MQMTESAVKKLVYSLKIIFFFFLLSQVENWNVIHKMELLTALVLLTFHLSVLRMKKKLRMEEKENVKM